MITGSRSGSLRKPSALENHDKFACRSQWASKRQGAAPVSAYVAKCRRSEFNASLETSSDWRSDKKLTDLSIEVIPLVIVCACLVVSTGDVGSLGPWKVEM